MSTRGICELRLGRVELTPLYREAEEKCAAASAAKAREPKVAHGIKVTVSVVRNLDGDSMTANGNSHTAEFVVPSMPCEAVAEAMIAAATTAAAKVLARALGPAKTTKAKRGRRS